MHGHFDPGAENMDARDPGDLGCPSQSEHSELIFPSFIMSLAEFRPAFREKEPRETAYIQLQPQRYNPVTKITLLQRRLATESIEKLGKGFRYAQETGREVL